MYLLVYSWINLFWKRFSCVIHYTNYFNPIRSGLFQTVNDPGGGGFKSPPPPTISKIILSIFTISYMWILPGVFGMIQLEFLKNSRFWPFYSDFKIKSSEISCKNNIFVILFKIDFKYTKRRGIIAIVGHKCDLCKSAKINGARYIYISSCIFDIYSLLTYNCICIFNCRIIYLLIISIIYCINYYFAKSSWNL